MNPQFKGLLDLICGFADFSGFIVIFAVSRALAEAGLAGANQSQLDEASFQVLQIDEWIAERSLRSAAAGRTAYSTRLLR